MLHSAGKLLELLGERREIYFESYLPYVDVWTRQGEERISVVARSRVVAASQRWSRQLQRLRPDALDALVAARLAQYPAALWDNDPELRPYVCPACGNQA